MSDRTDSFLKFIEDVITKKIVYHLFDDEVEFLGCVFLSYLLALEITCSCFHDFIDKDLIDLVLPDCLIEDEDFIKRSRSTLGEEVDHYIEPTEFEIQEMCLIEDEDFIKRLRSTLGEEVEMITSQLQGKLRLYDEVHTRLYSTSGIRACALRNFDLEDIIKKKSFTHKEEMAPMALSDSKIISSPVWKNHLQKSEDLIQKKLGI
ncbi:hypothetical protein Tco_0969240 [Tanacetum coccineum]